METAMLWVAGFVGLFAGLGFVITMDAHFKPEKYRWGMGIGAALAQAFNMKK